MLNQRFKMRWILIIVSVVFNPPMLGISINNLIHQLELNYKIYSKTKTHK